MVEADRWLTDVLEFHANGGDMYHGENLFAAKRLSQIRMPQCEHHLLHVDFSPLILPPSVIPLGGKFLLLSIALDSISAHDQRLGIGIGIGRLALELL